MSVKKVVRAMSNFIVCVYATQDTPYVQVAESTIIPSLVALDIPYMFLKVPNLGTWKKNTAYKPTFALGLLEAYPDKNIVLLDADCRVNSYPELFNNIPEQYNIAAHILDWKTWYNRPEATTKEFLSGTLFIRNSERSKFLLHQWELNCAKDNIWEQQVLAKVLIENKEVIYALPLEYCYINSLPDGQAPNVKVDNPVITHFQASRELKRTLK